MPPRTRFKVPSILLEVLAVIITISIVLWLWEVIADARNIPAFFLPKPSLIGKRFIEALQDGTIQRHLFITWSEALVAFAFAFLFASVVGYSLAKSPLLEKIVSPYLIASQSLPIFAIAPFVLIWVGNGFPANALMGALVAFFPMLVNTISAIRGIGVEQRELMQSYAATPWQIFSKLELPATLPLIMSSARIGITLSVIGVIVVELFWADRGLGFLLNTAERGFDTPLLFATILVLLLMNLTMYVALALLQRIVMPWRYKAREE